MTEWQVAEGKVTIVTPTHALFVAVYAEGRTNGFYTVPPTLLQPYHVFGVPTVTMGQTTEATSAGIWPFTQELKTSGVHDVADVQMTAVIWRNMCLDVPW